MNLGADLKDARRRFPLAITAGMITVVGLYLLLNFAYQRVLGRYFVWDASCSERPLRDRMRRTVASNTHRATRIPLPKSVTASRQRF